MATHSSVPAKITWLNIASIWKFSAVSLSASFLIGSHTFCLFSYVHPLAFLPDLLVINLPIFFLWSPWPGDPVICHSPLVYTYCNYKLVLLPCKVNIWMLRFHDWISSLTLTKAGISFLSFSFGFPHNMLAHMQNKLRDFIPFGAICSRFPQMVIERNWGRGTVYNYTGGVRGLGFLIQLAWALWPYSWSPLDTFFLS